MLALPLPFCLYPCSMVFHVYILSGLQLLFFFLIRFDKYVCALLECSAIYTFLWCFLLGQSIAYTSYEIIMRDLHTTTRPHCEDTMEICYQQIKSRSNCHFLKLENGKQRETVEWSDSVTCDAMNEGTNRTGEGTIFFKNRMLNLRCSLENDHIEFLACQRVEYDIGFRTHLVLLLASPS